jgi:hypothetical protein
MMLATGKGTVVYPVVVAVVDGIKCRALLDTGAGSSYISAELVKLLKKQPSRTEYRRINMMMSSTTQSIEIYDVTVADVRGKFEMKTQVSRLPRAFSCLYPILVMLISFPRTTIYAESRWTTKTPKLNYPFTSSLGQVFIPESKLLPSLNWVSLVNQLPSSPYWVGQ